MEGPLARLTTTFAQSGRVMWLGVRPARRAPVDALRNALITLSGLDGDRRDNPGKRAVTLIQWEHLSVIAALAGLDEVDPAFLRRNIAVAGINLLGLRKARFAVGAAILQGTGACAPCSRMEEALGPGGFMAMRGHGGITAEVIEPGEVVPGDAVVPLFDGD